MASERERFPHIVLQNISQGEKFSSPRRGGDAEFARVLDRQAHAQTLLVQIDATIAGADAEMERRAALIGPDQNGYYLEIESRTEATLLTDRLERRRSHIELLAVKREQGITSASLFIPQASKSFLRAIVRDYRDKVEPRSKLGEPKNWKLVEGIALVRLAALRDLWFDSSEFPADGEEVAWEVWLRPNCESRFRAAAARRSITLSTGRLVFPEETVIQVNATPLQLSELILESVSVSRLARSATTAEFFDSLQVDEQQDWTSDLTSRLNTSDPFSNVLCILDTGVKRSHPLLAPFLPAEDCHAYRSDWGVDDHHGHGTGMAGLALFGDLTPVLESSSEVGTPFCLESVNIFPPAGENSHDLLGIVTAGGIARVEIAKPFRRRTFCLATSTSEDSPHGGAPSSWAAEIDQLCAGADGDNSPRRIICVSGGNIRDLVRAADYPARNDLSEIESPAQAWNAITVGAFTKLTNISDSSLDGYYPLASEGDLCPTSLTSVCWESQWAVKPDVVLEGGNRLVDPNDGYAYTAGDLMLLTTSEKYPTPAFKLFAETSAATAQAARFCALIQNKYPDLWPETVRALLVGSARWTDRMLSYLPPKPKKSDYGTLMKRYGFGVPNLESALWSAGDALTLVVQDTIQPYRLLEKPSAVRANEMKLFPLPWPSEALQALETTEVELRVTLSYFIQPNPAEAARSRRQRYASFGLRFAMKLPDEDKQEFRKRINRLARDENESGTMGTDDQWLCGQQRDRGSLHSDIWRGPASDLARRDLLAVYPIGGWWKERRHLGKYADTARFSLIISIATPEVETDIYTPVVNMIAIGT